MRAFTIVVQPDPGHEGHLATIPDLPGFTATGRTVEECVERAHRVIGLFVDGLTPPGDAAELAAHGGATVEAEAEAIDALRRGMAALRTVECALEDEITLAGGASSRPLRRAHGALLRARHALVEEERRAVERTPDHAPV